MRKEIIQASALVYARLNAVHFQLPASFFMAISVAAQGKYKRTKTRKANAVSGV